MKKIIVLSLILLGFSSFSSLTEADVIPINVHYVDVCSKIINMGSYQDYYLIGFTDVWDPTISNKHYQKDFFIQDNECLKGQIILIAKKSYIDSIGGVDNIKTKDNNHNFDIEDENVFISNNNDITLTGSYRVTDNPLIKEYREYYIGDIINNKFNLVISKKILEYNNGTPTKTEIYKIDSLDVSSEINEISKITEILKIGIKNNDVKILQNFLNKKLNSNLIEDGNFGAKTKSAVILFQKSNNLSFDGIVGPKTIEKMSKSL